MPRMDIDRDSFVARLDFRRRWFGRLARLLHSLRLLRKPVQAAAYDWTFRSDEEVVTYAYARTNDHLPDLENPRWFNEKIRWLFLHHRNPLMTLVADKVGVRDYLAYKGARIAPPRMIAAGICPKALAILPLPTEFALKSAYGSGQNHIETPGRNTPRAELVAKASRWREYDQWRATGEFQYRDVPKRWLIEELLPCGDQIEYKIFCIMGVPTFILVLSDRRGPKQYKRMLYDTNWNPVGFHWDVFPPIEERPVPRPANLETMLADARLLSADFLQVRVDFLQCGDRTVFSELTFASAAARIPFTPLAANIELGDLIDLSRAPEYLLRGRRVAADVRAWLLRGALPRADQQDRRAS